jgi:single-strand DNA-binding protein
MENVIGCHEKIPRRCFPLKSNISAGFIFIRVTETRSPQQPASFSQIGSVVAFFYENLTTKKGGRKMASSVNKVILLGRLGADPELRYTTGGDAVATFNMATTETWKDKNGGKQEKTEWHRVVAWRKLGEIAGEYLKKGRLAYVEGKIQSRDYEGKDGVKRKIHEIAAIDVKLLPSGNHSQQPQGGDQRTSSGFSRNETDDFIPEINEDDIKM